MNQFQALDDQTFETPTEVHHSAVVHPAAELDSGVVVGPGAIIGPEVKIGPGTVVGANAVLEGRLTIGSQNRIFPSACLGLEPQDLKYDGASTEVIIGNRNTIRECVTINKATYEGEKTKIGDDNLLMAYCHLGHNCELGNRIVMSNAIQVAGHVVIEDRAVIGGCLGIHQFVHIGKLAMVGGMTRVDRDVPPYSLAEGHPARLRGLNRVGLRRSGFENQAGSEFRQLQEIWSILFRSEHVLSKGLEIARRENLTTSSEYLCNFVELSIKKGRRGLIPSISSIN